MKVNSSRLLPVWLIATLAGAAMLSAVTAYMVLRRPPPLASPPLIVVSPCRDVPSGMQRGGFEVKFDVPEACCTLDSVVRDMLPEVIFGVRIKTRDNEFMEIRVGHVDFEAELSSRWTLTSDRVEKRAVRDSRGDWVGEDHWGHWKGRVDQWGHWVSGKSWRYVTFARGGTAVGYLPTADREAQVFDSIISSACFSAIPHP